LDKEYLFEPGNIQSICDELENLELEKLGIMAQSNFNKAKNYSQSILINRRKKFYDEILKENGLG
jgi:hypothetical protein